MQSAGGLIASLRVQLLVQPFVSTIVRKTSIYPVVFGMGMLAVWPLPADIVDPLLME